MKIKPIVYSRIQATHTSFRVDLKLETNVTFICGDSGVGKSALFSILEEYAAEDSRLRCYNYLDQSGNYKAVIKRAKEKLFIIDNADVLLNDPMREYIAMDDKNQYILIGRNPTGLLLMQDEIYELDSRKNGDVTEFFLKKSLA